MLPVRDCILSRTLANIISADEERKNFGKRKRESNGSSYPQPDPHHRRETFPPRPSPPATPPKPAPKRPKARPVRHPVLKKLRPSYSDKKQLLLDIITHYPHDRRPMSWEELTAPGPDGKPSDMKKWFHRLLKVCLICISLGDL
jgi:hypothetical protein